MSEQEKAIEEILNRYPKEKRFSLAIMQDMQHKFQYIPREGLEALSEWLGTPLSSLYGMATFYKALSLKPKGKNIIKLCDGTACHIRGSQKLVDGVVRNLGIHPGETTEDGMFSLELVNCLGSCAMAPVMVINETYYGKMTVEKIPEILDIYRKGEAAT